MNLNLIGNGFDLYHGLPSSYYYYGCYLLEKYPDVYEEMSKWFNFRIVLSYRGYPLEDVEYGVESQFWSVFEERLGIVDDTAIVETYDHDLGLEIEDYDIPMEDDLLAERIKETFREWVCETLEREDNYKIIESSISKSLHRANYKMDFGENDRFLVFNYTHALQKIYGVDDWNIHYVHGECTGDDSDELIIGHRNKKYMEEVREQIRKYENRALYQIERTRKLEYECLLRLLRRLEKNVEQTMEMVEWSYERFQSEPQKINVYGMSLGEVDYPYFEQIRERWPNAKWNFSYFSDKDKAAINTIVKKLGLPQNQYSEFRFCNSEAQAIANEIIENLGIATYLDEDLRM